ncbi:rhomboid family intramembrane serine protease [uncultured Acetobacteroides sp.]|uniref:rhomboid family intramembrane serine protease n=1 Tax=uncultured Acetobacteroides sp. TaxID=1760811 RepID=UPI0029F52459|nr:rhomboid family intramembrane serine protease [uncultured Acetobacteroides sp.]
MEKRRLKIALFASTYMLLLVWLAFFVEYLLGDSMPNLGIMPREWGSIANFLAAPFIHKSIDHLLNNSIVFFILSLTCFYFYGGITLWVVLGGVVSGFFVWVFGREAYHMGLSGVCYCLTSFLFFSGIVRKNISLMTISLLVAFLQSEMIWGLFPSLNEPLNISWEGHLSGGAAGFFLAFYYRKQGPPNDPEPEDDFEDEGGENQHEGDDNPPSDNAKE